MAQFYQLSGNFISFVFSKDESVKYRIFYKELSCKERKIAMPLETLPLLQDNTRLVQHGDTLYKLRVKYDRESLKHLKISEAEAHHEIVQVFRAVVHMIQNKKEIVKPILTRHFLVQIQQSQWAFLKKYRSLVFSKRNKVLSVHENVTDFLVKNIASALKLTNCQKRVNTSLHEKKKNHQSNEVIIIGSAQDEKAVTRSQNGDSGAKKGKDSDKTKEPAVLVYSEQKSQPAQCGSRFYRDESGRMCRVVQANTQHHDPADTTDGALQTGKHATSADRAKSRPHTALEKTSNQPISVQESKDKIQASTNVTFSPNRYSPRGKRYSERLKAVNDDDSDSQTKQVNSTLQKRSEQERKKSKRVQRANEEKITLTEESDSGSDSINQPRHAANRPSRRKSRRLESKQHAAQIESSQSESQTETDADLEPVSKKVKLRSGLAKISEEEGQSSRDESRGTSWPRRKSERLTRHAEQASSQSEEEETDIRHNKGTESHDSQKQRKRKLYAACSSPQLIAGASQDKPALASPRISTVRPVKRDTGAAGTRGQNSGGARGQHTSPRRPNQAASPRSRRLQEDETRRMQQLRNPVNSPVVPNYRDVLHNRRDRHAVEQAEREETTKLLQLYEPTVPRRSPRYAPRSDQVQAGSSGMLGRIYDTIMTPAKKLLAQILERKNAKADGGGGKKANGGAAAVCDDDEDDEDDDEDYND